MEDIKWLEVVLDTTEEELEGLCARLTANGVTGMAIEDEEDFKTFLEQNRQYWDYVDEGLMEQMRGVCRVKLYVTDDDDGKKQLARWLEGIDLPYTAASLGENDWAHSWQKYYKPMAVGERLYIVPEWEREEPVPAGKVPLYLNPGLTFGTGNHASTQLCLAGLEAYTVPGQPVLDLGCGSGILSIAALALGASEAAAVDIDPRRWTWPTRTPPSTASEGIATPCWPETCCPIRIWSAGWGRESTPWFWPTSWPT